MAPPTGQTVSMYKICPTWKPFSSVPVNQSANRQGVFRHLSPPCEEQSSPATSVLTVDAQLKAFLHKVRLKVHKQAKIMSYDRILSMQNLNEVSNPWKGFTMNRCLALALIVLLVGAGVHQFHNAVDIFVEETGINSFIGSIQDGSITQISLWDKFTSWWGSEELGAIRKRKKPIGSKTALKPKTAKQ